MLTRLDLRFFKCFELLRLPLGSLTLLSGGNASGKSSVLQALVLLHQTMREHEWSTRLLLNGESIQMGTVTDVVDKVNGRYTFEIGVVDDAHPYQWAFTGERSDRSMPVDRVIVGDVTNEKPVFFRPRSAEAAQVLNPQLDSSGNIDTWPEGFFDQFDKDTSHFAGWGE